eukprot:3198657-Pyramimonas_sp.AAC.1
MRSARGIRERTWDAQRHTNTVCPPRRRASDPNIQYTHPVVYRFASGAARKRPPRRLYYKISRCARRPWGGDAHIV